MVFEILGVNLLEVIKRYNYKGVPLPLCRILARQLLLGLDYLHRVCQVIHTDLKPENVSLSLSEKEVLDIASKGQLTTHKNFDLNA
jgi:serine/threonine-protein kinase SRPK3